MTDKLLIEKSVPGKHGISLPKNDCPAPELNTLFPESSLRDTPPALPELSEPEVVRHFYNLAKKNYSIDEGIYPLGSCTMKYNPKVNEEIAKLDGFTYIHPYQPIDSVQGALELIYELQSFLAELTGMDKVTLQPAAGAHGEFTGVAIIRAYHESRGDTRRKMIVPDSAHGTNPASSAMNGFDVVEVKSNSNGLVDIDALKNVLDTDVAGIMLTNPNTLGLFEREIVQIAKLAHDVGALLYYDGANMNAILGYARPGDMGFDVVHLNLHKTFSTPHGTGGPGSGPIGVKKVLIPFLPIPTVEYSAEEDKYYLDYSRPKSIGRVRSFYGNFTVLVKAYAYILSVGRDNMKKIAQMAVLNANYLKSLIKGHYLVPYDTICKHEFVATGKEYKRYGIKTLDIAKRLLDYGVHPPTIYFPLIVPEALMFEPTETESKRTLDRYADILNRIAEEAEKAPELLRDAPSSTPVKRLDEVKAARDMKLRW